MDMNSKPPPVAAVPRHRGRPKLVSDDTQRSLVAEGARQLFIEKGYGRTTTDDVAARCKISKQTLYRLFPGKPALFAAVVDAHRYSMLALPGDYDDLPIDEALQKIFRIDIDPQSERDNLALLRLVMLESQQHPELEELLFRYGAEKARADLAKWLRARCKREQIELGDANSAVHILLDMIFGPMVLKLDAAVTRRRPPKRQDHIRRCISIFLYGISGNHSGRSTA
jgi:TetR/AcrR family transcriptional repressor of mexJK operon